MFTCTCTHLLLSGKLCCTLACSHAHGTHIVGQAKDLEKKEESEKDDDDEGGQEEEEEEWQQAELDQEDQGEEDEEDVGHTWLKSLDQHSNMFQSQGKGKGRSNKSNGKGKSNKNKGTDKGKGQKGNGKGFQKGKKLIKKGNGKGIQKGSKVIQKGNGKGIQKGSKVIQKGDGKGIQKGSKVIQKGNGKGLQCKGIKHEQDMQGKQALVKKTGLKCSERHRAHSKVWHTQRSLYIAQGWSPDKAKHQAGIDARLYVAKHFGAQHK